MSNYFEPIIVLFLFGYVYPTQNFKSSNYHKSIISDSLNALTLCGNSTYQLRSLHNSLPHQDSSGRHGCDAVLDILSHLALDLQQVVMFIIRSIFSEKPKVRSIGNLVVAIVVLKY